MIPRPRRQNVSDAVRDALVMLWRWLMAVAGILGLSVTRLARQNEHILCLFPRIRRVSE